VKSRALWEKKEGQHSTGLRRTSRDVIFICRHTFRDPKEKRESYEKGGERSNKGKGRQEKKFRHGTQW